MARDARFWRNVTIIALVHIVLLIGLFCAGAATPKKAIAQQISPG